MRRKKTAAAAAAGQEALHPAADRNHLWVLAPEHERLGKTVHLDEFQTMASADFAITSFRPLRIPETLLI